MTVVGIQIADALADLLGALDSPLHRHRAIVGKRGPCSAISNCAVFWSSVAYTIRKDYAFLPAGVSSQMNTLGLSSLSLGRYHLDFAYLTAHSKL